MICSILSFSLFSYGRPPEKHYFITGGGNHVDIKKINYFNFDSLFFDGMERSNTHILVDSIAEYHHFKHGKGGVGFLIGWGIGSCIGYTIALGQGFPESVNSPAPAIAAIGGGLLGLAIGCSSKIELDIDLRKYNKVEKQKLLIDIFTN